MEEPYRQLLSEAECDEYESLGAVIDRISQKQRRLLQLWAGVMAVAMVVVLIGAGVSMGTARDGGESAVPWLIAANVILFAYLFGNLVPITVEAREMKEARTRRDRLLQEAKYRYADGRRHGGGLSESKSVRQTQREWYGNHSELDWRDRQRAQMYGMDAETYISNVLENDRD